MFPEFFDKDRCKGLFKSGTNSTCFLATVTEVLGAGPVAPDGCTRRDVCAVVGSGTGPIDVTEGSGACEGVDKVD